VKRLAVKPFFFRLLRGVPMPIIAIVVGLLAGLAVWIVLDQVQSQQVSKIFATELRTQLDQSSRESLIRFDRYMSSYTTTARLLANHRRLAEYLEPLLWSPEQKFAPVVYRNFRPGWLPDLFARSGLNAPSHVLLVDRQGRVREVYQSGKVPLPKELAGGVGDQFRDPSDVRTVLTRFDDQPYLLVSDAIEDSGGFEMGSLVVLIPVDDAFLAASQRGMFPDRAAAALVDADDDRIIASVDPDVLLPGSTLAQWEDSYLITSQSLPQYEGSDWNVVFTTFVPLSSVDKMSRHVRSFEWRQRAIAAFVFIAVYTLVIYLVSVRLNKVLRRMSRFSQRALGIQEPGFKRGGNQLLRLEEWIQQFTQLVLLAREELSRKYESEVRESEALKAAIMEASLDSIVTLDKVGHIIEFNPTAERTLQLDRAAVIGGSFTELFLSPASRAVFLGLLDDSRRARRHGSPPYARGELTARRLDGSEIPVELSIVPIRLDSELFYTLYMHDITGRREAEREIQSLARFASESPNPILRVNPEGLVVYANGASEPLLSAWGAGKGHRLPPVWVIEVRETLEDGTAREREVELGAQVYSLLIAPIQDLGYINIYARDITAVRRAEQESRQHQAELVHVCRLSTMGEVATGMAHELNQPLSAIVNFANGCSRRLQGGMGERGELVEAMSQITSQAQRASEIIRRLRALVGKQPPIRSQVDLNYLVREVCSFVEFETTKLDFAVALDLAEGEILVDVDLVQIEQVLLNLVRNALDALQDVESTERRLTIRTRLAGNAAEATVEDNGPGIPAERIQYLFEPFFTTKETGMGMGLPISQTIVANHGGTIWVESLAGGGATFHVRLPIAQAGEQALQAVRTG
jgi:two-component system, LuxR family, sensor kinase FixL